MTVTGIFSRTNLVALNRIVTSTQIKQTANQLNNSASQVNGKLI